MHKKYLLFILLQLIAVGGFCQATKNINNTIGNEIKLEALDLTEDASILSSHNDELMIFVFKKSTTDSSLNLIYSNTAILDHKNFTKSIFLPDSLASDTLILALIENDTHKSLAQLAKILEGNIYKLKNARAKNEENTVYEILQDDDLLGICNLEPPTVEASITQKIIGQHMFDKFDYRIKRQLKLL